MAELVAKKEAVVRQDIAKADALKMFGDRGETYKCELISELEDGHITTYTQGAFTDLCRGPHLMTTAPIKAIKLTSVAGAYWRGQEDRKMMTRIYGITFPKKKMLDEYLVLLEEAKKRDHRKIGKEMDLFMFSDTVGKGRSDVVAKRYCTAHPLTGLLTPHPGSLRLSRGNVSAYRQQIALHHFRSLCKIW